MASLYDMVQKPISLTDTALMPGGHIDTVIDGRLVYSSRRALTAVYEDGATPEAPAKVTWYADPMVYTAAEFTDARASGPDLVAERTAAIAAEMQRRWADGVPAELLAQHGQALPLRSGE